MFKELKTRTSELSKEPWLKVAEAIEGIGGHLWDGSIPLRYLLPSYVRSLPYIPKNRPACQNIPDNWIKFISEISISERAYVETILSRAEREYKTLEELRNAQLEDLRALRGIAKKSAKCLKVAFGNLENR